MRTQQKFLPWRIAWLACALLAPLLPVRPAAAYVLGSFDWDSGTTESWSRDHVTWPVLTNPGSGGNPASGGYLSITFPSIPEDPGDNWYDVISVDAASLFAGNWSTAQWLEFDFFAEDVAPAGLQLQWGVDGGNTWGHAFDTTDMQTGQWNNMRTSFLDWDDWDIAPFLSESDYLADLENIDWVGLYIYRSGTDEQVYGLDNFRLQIPEPEEYAMMTAALLAVVLSLRKRKASART